MTEVKRYSLVKPTLNTPFHIDFDHQRSLDSIRCNEVIDCFDRNRNRVTCPQV